jgi:ubiquitin C-terminal hydrolase
MTVPCDFEWWYIVKDEDVLLAQHFLSYPQRDASSLKYYVVPSAWFSQVWKILHHPTTTNDPTASVSDASNHWKETIGPINNASLFPPPFLDELQKVQHSNEENNIERGEEEEKTSAAPPVPRHISDFCLIGSNAWLLLSSKFGHDAVILVCSCARVSSGAGMLVEVNGFAAPIFVPMPPAGRFPYELYFAAKTTTAMATAALSTAIVPSVASDDETPAIVRLPADDALLEEEETSIPDMERPDPPAEVHRSGEPKPNEEDDEEKDPTNSPISSRYDSPRILRSTVSSTVLVRRQYGSGLGNLGNTCFMNSTLQCLAHTPALQNYFLSRQYQGDLNLKNPLGTGGELATEFAQLLQEMWMAPSTLATPTLGDPVLYTTASHVVYPRNFKYTLGKHAAQFMGYDQHDSQELATYLLDALHEDCNRITEKPYIEKPEQTEQESDPEASAKAWDLHLQREDSHVLEYFMGQVKSRVQCNQEHCQRISTTFDPFMFLSVPIPGSDDRTVRLTFVPLDPLRRPQKLAVKVSKLATVEELVRRLMEQVGTTTLGSTTVDDFIVCDMWKHSIFEWFQNKDDLERIRDNDETFVYQVRPLTEIRQCEALWNDETANDSPNGDFDKEILQQLGLQEWIRTGKRRPYQLDLATLTQLNRDHWSQLLQTKYMKAPLMLINAFHPKKGSSEERVRIYRRLARFLDELHQSVLDEDSGDDDDDEIFYGSSGAKRVRADLSNAASGKGNEGITEIMDCAYRNGYFKNVQSLQDIAILEFLAGKMFREIIQLERRKKEVFPNGVLVEIRISSTEGSYPSLSPLAIRIPSSTTVYQFRELMAHRLSRCFRSSNGRERGPRRNLPKVDIWTNPDDDWQVERRSPEYETPMESGNLEDEALADPLDILRRIPLNFERKSSASTRTYFPSKPLGSVMGRHAHNHNSYLSDHRHDSFPVVQLADPDHLEEKEYIADLVGNAGQIFLSMPSSLMDYVFDYEEYQAVDDESLSSSFNHGSRQNPSITVLDCVEKFCQMEQLEESEQWYCNKCKEHVCAWKQFHIYRSPPHLIIHLKRFQYSARTHRRQKINTHVDFPLVGLDLSNQVLHWTDQEKPIYDCYAVSNHYGGLGGGHYTAYALNDDGVWCHYDDSRITSHIEPSEVVSQAAYVLYYRRRDVSAEINYEMIAAALKESPALTLRRETNNHVNPLFRPICDPIKTTNQAARIEDDFFSETPNHVPTDPEDEEEDGSHSSMSPARADSGKRVGAVNLVPEDEEDDGSVSSNIPVDDDEERGLLRHPAKSKGSDYKRGSSLPLQ